jgi:23S rRNA pseudouridine2605 synthase
MRDIRIQKAIADAGICSRRRAEALITAGRVKLNGRPVKLGDKMDKNKDILSIDGKNIKVLPNRSFSYYALNKPRGYITTVKDDFGRKTVMDLIEGIEERVYPVGRLDRDSEGLLIFTNDGNLANALMHPSNGIEKVYRVSTRPKAEEHQIISLSEGVVLDDGTRTLPAAVRIISEDENRTVMEMSIKEGKNRQIRRMCSAVGLDVIRLSRKSEGPIKLGMLKPGKYRELTESEVRELKNLTAKTNKK